MKRWAILFLLLLVGTSNAVTRSVPTGLRHSDYDSAFVVKYPAGDKTKADTSSTVAVPFSSLTSLNDDTTWVLDWYFWEAGGDTVIARDIVPSAASSPVSAVTTLPLKMQSAYFDSVLWIVYKGPDYSTQSTFRLPLPADTSVSINLAHNQRIYRLLWSTVDTASAYYSIAHMPGDTSGFPIASSPSTCRLNGTVRDGAGAPVSHAWITATIPKAKVSSCDSTLLVQSTVTTRANKSGYFEIDLVWSSCLNDEKWKVTISKKGFTDRNYTITVPDSTGHDFYELVNQ